LRGDQSDHRSNLRFVEYDATRDLIKASPLLDFSREHVAAFCAENEVPVNTLHDKGFLSIGCAPCTRALKPGEPERAGRWWWESEDKKECGLHLAADGRIVRAKELANS
jgi:phosphoadenosine phosphosulfate reductase